NSYALIPVVSPGRVEEAVVCRHRVVVTHVRRVDDRIDAEHGRELGIADFEVWAERNRTARDRGSYPPSFDERVSRVAPPIVPGHSESRSIGFHRDRRHELSSDRTVVVELDRRAPCPAAVAR